jgi:hypothetical protein
MPVSQIESDGLINPLGVGVRSPSHPLHVLRADVLEQRQQARALLSS